MSAAAWVVLAAAVVVTWWGTGLARRFALARAVLDVPSERSLHATPMPRGGGVAIAVVILAGILAGTLGGWVRSSVALALVPGGAAIAYLGWLDDRRGLPMAIRLLVQSAAASWMVYWIGAVTTLDVGIAHWPLGWLAAPICVVGIVWLANLYNFMDGIDGLAAGETMLVGVVAMLFCVRAGDPESAWLAGLAAAACAGFLPWNWMPARIFMGDSGSVFLGSLLGALALLTDRSGALPVTAWVLLLGLFVTDATITLLRRMARRERWHAAHRSHAYQRLVQSGWTHQAVSAAVIGVSAALAALVWLALAVPAVAPGALVLAVVIPIAAYLAVGRIRPM